MTRVEFMGIYDDGRDGGMGSPTEFARFEERYGIGASKPDEDPDSTPTIEIDRISGDDAIRVGSLPVREFTPSQPGNDPDSTPTVEITPAPEDVAMQVGTLPVRQAVEV